MAAAAARAGLGEIVLAGGTPRTFAEAVASRPTWKPVPSPSISVGVRVAVSRLAETVRGIQARSRETRIASLVPGNVSAFVCEAIEAACTYYEDLFNGGRLCPAGRPRRLTLAAASSDRAREPANPRQPGGIVIVGSAPLTFAEAIGARPAGEPPRSRTVHIPKAVAERAGATLPCILSRSHGTRIGRLVPGSLAALGGEAVQAACTFYEDLLNGGALYGGAPGSH